MKLRARAHLGTGGLSWALWAAGGEAGQKPNRQCRCLSVCDCLANASYWKPTSPTSEIKMAVIGCGQGRVPVVAGGVVHSHLLWGGFFTFLPPQLHCARSHVPRSALPPGPPTPVPPTALCSPALGVAVVPKLDISFPPPPGARVCSSQTW